VNDPDRSATWHAGTGIDLPERLWVLDDLSAATDRPGQLTGGLVSLGFLKSALRRGRKVWCLTAAIGLVVGLGLYTKFPPAFKATTSVLLADNPSEDPAVEVQTDAALAQSTVVAEGVIKQLGLSQSASSLLGTYSVTVVTDRVLTFTVSAPTSDAALKKAAAIASQFLKFRAQYAQTQEQQTIADLGQQVSQAQQNLKLVEARISQVSAEPSSSTQKAELTKLQNTRTAATNTLALAQQYQTGTLLTIRTATRQMVQDSQVLNDASPMKPSRLKGMPLYVGGGLIGGLALGMLIIIIRAIVSERLLRRDDVAAALGSPVRLSVRSLGPKGRLPGLGRSGGASEKRDLRRVVEHLRNCIPGSSRGPASLAVVAVNNAPTVARTVVSLAEDAAREGRRVLLADLSEGRNAASLLGNDKPGVGTVSSEGAKFVLVVPEADDVAPIGPIRSPLPLVGYARPSEQLQAAGNAADLLLTLVTLDASFGGDHLSTWAADAVAVITAGESTAAKAHAVGQMVRLSGTRLDSVVLLGADKSDESLGAANALDRPVAV
jgi:capsular polysaccharide biosynthesis protein